MNVLHQNDCIYTASYVHSINIMTLARAVLPVYCNIQQVCHGADTETLLQYLPSVAVP